MEKWNYSEVVPIWPPPVELVSINWIDVGLTMAPAVPVLAVLMYIVRVRDWPEETYVPLCPVIVKV